MASWINTMRSNSANTDGLMEAMKGNFQGAIKKFTKAVELNPENLEARFHLGVAHIDAKEYDQALVELGYVISIDPEYELAFYNRAVAYSEMEKFELALRDLDRAIDLVQDGKNYILRRMVHSLLNEHDKALEDANSILAVGEKIYGYVNRAIVYHDMQNYPLEIADWTTVLELSPKHDFARFNRGITYEMIGEKDNAIADLKEVLRKSTSLDKSIQVLAHEALTRLGAE